MNALHFARAFMGKISGKLALRGTARPWMRAPIYLGALLFIIIITLLLSKGGLDLGSSSSGGAYTLVPEKVSRTAEIPVTLPPDILPEGIAPEAVFRFEPPLAGSWKAPSENAPSTFRFLPETAQAEGTYFRAIFDTPGLRLEKMFMIDKDPQVLLVLPRGEAEVNEYTNITIMFSRPMVALSTLAENADITPPVSISPATKGRWKWVTTRTLEFIPETHLDRASRYSVEIGTGFRSTDGVAVAPFAHAFTTRTLRLHTTTFGEETLDPGTPVRFFFNMPVDIEAMDALIRLSSNNIPQAFSLRYGTRQIADPDTGKEKTYTDRSVLEVFLAKDKHGRPDRFDFGERYTVELLGAVPWGGALPLREGTTRIVSTLPVISNVYASSPKSTLVRPDLFDPEGSLHVVLGEAIDLSRSRITGKGIAKITYAEKCREPLPGEEVVYRGSECTKVEDRTGLTITFLPDVFARNETSVVRFEKLVNQDGLTLSDEPIERAITTYPRFAILETKPKRGEVGAPLDAFTICSNTPIARPSDDEFYKKVRANMMIGYWNWFDSFYVGTPSKEGCPVGTFQTTIDYGLVADYNYELTLDLVDHFGATITHLTNFTTRKADPRDVAITGLQPSVLMTTPGKTELVFALDFLREVEVTICKVRAEDMLRMRRERPGRLKSAASLPCTDSAYDRITLPATPESRKHVRVDIAKYFPKALGNYVVVLTHPSFRAVEERWDSKKNAYTRVVGEQIYEKTFISVTRLAVGMKSTERDGWTPEWCVECSQQQPEAKQDWPGNLYWVNDALSLAPSEGVRVTQWNTIAKGSGRPLQMASALTDETGIATLPSQTDFDGAVVTNGTDEAVVSPHTDAFSWTQEVDTIHKEYLYTDRPIYRPGDTVHIKGIMRTGFDGTYTLGTGTTSLTLYGPRASSIAGGDAPISAFGTYTKSIILDANTPLGHYSIQSSRGGWGSFQVEAYVAPDFKVAITSDKEEYIAGDTVSLDVEANYYFGVPIERGEASYRIVAQNYYFDRYRDEYFGFGSGWYDRSDGWYGDSFVTSGKAPIGRGGKVAIAEKLDFDKLFSKQGGRSSKLMTVYVTVVNETGKSVTSTHSFIVHRGAYYAGVRLSEYFYRVNDNATLRIKTVDVNGEPLAVKNLGVTVEKIEWDSYKRQEVDGHFYYRTEIKRTPVIASSVHTDKNGDGAFVFQIKEPGEYEGTATGVGKDGNTVTSSASFYVSGEGHVRIRETNNDSLELVAERSDVAVGDTARFIIKSPKQGGKALVTVSAGDTYGRDVINIDSSIVAYEFPVTEAMVPNMVAEVLLLSPGPDVKFGRVEYTIDNSAKNLDVTITPKKARYVPGESVTLDVLVKDWKGSPQEAELSLAVVDMSVLALVGNPKKNPVAFFYDWKPLTIRTSANVKNILEEVDIPTGTKGGGGGGRT